MREPTKTKKTANFNVFFFFGNFSYNNIGKLFIIVLSAIILIWDYDSKLIATTTTAESTTITTTTTTTKIGKIRQKKFRYQGNFS